MQDIYDKVIIQIKNYIESIDDISKYTFGFDNNIIIVKKYGKKYCHINLSHYTKENILNNDVDWENYLFNKLDNTSCSNNSSDRSHFIQKQPKSSEYAKYVEKHIKKPTTHSYHEPKMEFRSESRYEPRYEPKYEPRYEPRYEHRYEPRYEHKNIHSCSQSQRDPCSCGNCTNSYVCQKNGIKGDTGPMGLKGDTGLNGPQGLKGDTGPQGIRGLQGVEGLMGQKGDTGSPGTRGDTGCSIRGDTGMQGDTGASGARGDTGMQGNKGDTGARGKKGSTGCRGKKGDTGCEGRRGHDGFDGCQGPKGDTGCRGFCGQIGATGLQGSTGATGLGATGATGFTGPAGPQGLIGPQGTQGIRGLIGPTGPALPLTITNSDTSTFQVSNLQLDKTLYYDGTSQFVSAIQSEFIATPLTNITTFHDKAIIASSNINMQDTNNHNTCITASSNGTSSNNSSQNFIASSDNFIIDGTSFNNGIIASKNIRTTSSINTAFIASTNDVGIGLITNVTGGAIIGSNNSIIQLGTDCCIMGSNNSSIKTLTNTTSNLVSNNNTNLEGSFNFFGASVNNTNINNANNSSILSSTSMNISNFGNNNSIIGGSNTVSSNWENINNSVLIASNMNNLSNGIPRSSNTLVGANSSGLTWEINSETGSIVNEGTISSSTPISGFAKMMCNMTSGIITPGLLLRIVSKNKVRVCNDNESPQLVSRQFNACTYVTNNADLKWHKTFMRNVWGTVVYENVIDTAFEKTKVLNKNATFDLSNLLTTLNNNRSIIINKIAIINNKVQKTNADLANLAILQSDLLQIDNDIKLNQNKYITISNWLSINQSITKYISVPKINPELNPTLVPTYLSRNKRPLEWTPCEWSGMAPVIVDLTVTEENYVTSGPNGIGKFSNIQTRVYCVEILDTFPTNVEIDSVTNQLLISGLYKIALCSIF